MLIEQFKDKKVLILSPDREGLSWSRNKSGPRIKVMGENGRDGRVYL